MRSFSLRKGKIKKSSNGVSARIFGNKCRALMAAAKSSPSVSKAVLKAADANLMKVHPISPALAEFLGSTEASPTDAFKKICAYIKSNNLQNPNNEKEISCDDKLKTIFLGNDLVNENGITKFLYIHFPKTLH